MSRRHALALALAGAVGALVACAGTTGPATAPAAAPTPATSAAPAPAGSAATTATPTVDEIIDAHIRARGGADRLHKLAAMRVSGNAIFPDGKEAVIVREIARPGRVRLEVKYQGLTAVYADDGGKAWQVAPLQGKFDPEPIPAAVGGSPVDQRDIEGPLLDWKAKGHTVTLVGRTRVGEREAYDLEVKLKGGGVRHDLIDTETYRLLQVDTDRIVAGRKVPVVFTFDDYRTVDGLSLPYRIETKRRGEPRGLQIRVSSVELDPALDASRFRMPEPAPK
jgi:hypothetical protein